MQRHETGIFPPPASAARKLRPPAAVGPASSMTGSIRGAHGAQSGSPSGWSWSGQSVARNSASSAVQPSSWCANSIADGNFFQTASGSATVPEVNAAPRFSHSVAFICDGRSKAAA